MGEVQSYGDAITVIASRSASVASATVAWRQEPRCYNGFRGLSDPNASLERLVTRGEVLLGETTGEEDGTDDDAATEDEPAP